MNAEIHMQEPFGIEIYKAIMSLDLRHNLEIGSWDGEGSTNCFVQAMRGLSADKSLQCIELDPAKYEVLAQRYKDMDFVRCYNMSSIGYEDMLYTNFEDVWNSAYNKINKKIYGKELVSNWFASCLKELQSAPKAFDMHKDEAYDAVLIDGSEFTGYSEFKLLEDKTRVFMLDDVHHAFKCYQIYDELNKSTDWALHCEDPGVRNGYAIFVRR